MPHATPSIFILVSETIILREYIKDLIFVVLGMDSADIVDYVLRIEEEFGCNIDEFDTLSQHMGTVDEMINYLVQFLENGGEQ